MSRTLVSICLLCVACGGEAVVIPGGGDTAADVATTAAADPARWPRDFVTGPGTGPALFLSEAPDAPAIGYVSEGVALRLGSLPANGRVKVRIDGSLKVRGWIRMERLALIVTEGGRIGGTPISVAPGNYLRVLGPDEDSELMRVRVAPNLGRGADIGMEAFDGVYPTARLGIEMPTAEANEATPRRLPAGQAVEVYARPDEVIATIPAMDPGLVVDLARDRGTWKGVRVGVGPFLAGYVNVDLADAEALEIAAPVQVAEPGSVPLRLRVDETRPLWRIPAGSRIRYGQDTIGILETDAFAREMGRYEETQEVDVFVASDDGVALRGTVPMDVLVAVEPPADAAPAAPATAPAAAAPAP